MRTNKPLRPMTLSAQDYVCANPYIILETRSHQRYSQNEQLDGRQQVTPLPQAYLDKLEVLLPGCLLESLLSSTSYAAPSKPDL